jgi:hypothetical protein
MKMVQIQKNHISVIYHNIMEILTNQNTALDRVRDTAVSSKHGLYANMALVLTDFYKDDVLQPKPSPKLRL